MISGKLVFFVKSTCLIWIRNYRAYDIRDYIQRPTKTNSCLYVKFTRA